VLLKKIVARTVASMKSSQCRFANANPSGRAARQTLPSWLGIDPASWVPVGHVRSGCPLGFLGRHCKNLRHGLGFAENCFPSKAFPDLIAGQIRDKPQTRFNPSGNPRVSEGGIHFFPTRGNSDTKVFTRTLVPSFRISLIQIDEHHANHQ
jgi:hypothetical protein